MAKRKQNASSGGNSLLTLGLLAVGGYFVYEWFFATPAAVATTTTGTPATGTTTTTGTPAAGPSTSSSSTTGGSSPAGPAPVPAVPLDDIYTSMLALIADGGTAGGAQDPNFTGSGSNLTGTPYHFDVYLQLAAAGSTVPDPTVVFGSATGADQPMTAATYWASMGPAMAAANPGLSGFGLGRYAGVGAYFRGLGAYAWR